MPVTIDDQGQRNRVTASQDVLANQDGQIVFEGDDSSVVLGEGTLWQGGRIRLGSGSTFSSGHGCHLANVDVHLASGGHVRIGDQAKVSHHSRLVLLQPGQMIFGDGCRIAGGTTVMAAHSTTALGSEVSQPGRLDARDDALIAGGGLSAASSAAAPSPAATVAGNGRCRAVEIRDIAGVRRTADRRILSWAQNAEDIMLLRMFGHKPRGTWIDVGANHPSHDSVTRNFYEMGWRGINVEPLEELHRQLREERPEDVNLWCAASDRSGELTFHRDESHLDWSTCDPHAALQYEAGGHTIRRVQVPVTTLAEICRRHLQERQPVDFLKIDVERHELAVLAGHDFSIWRPTVVVAEAQPEHSRDMDDLLASRGYVRRWFDGSNNWYVDVQQAEAVPTDLWRPVYPVRDWYHPWVYVQHLPLAPPSDHPAASPSAVAVAPMPRDAAPAHTLLGTATDTVRSVVRSLRRAGSHMSDRSWPQDVDPMVPLLGRFTDAPAGLVTTIHPNDDVFRHIRAHVPGNELARSSYLRYGSWILSELRQIVDWRFGSFHQVGRLLEFACGYGRLTRFLVQAMPRERVWVSDIDEQAVRFEQETFGVNGFVSSRDPDVIHRDERFEFIFVVSLFSHLPRRAFSRMLEKLLSMLTADGILAFTVHDEMWCPHGTMPADGFAFVPQSESTHLRSDDYGTTFVAEHFVRDCIAGIRGAGWPYARIPRGLCSHQDIYLVGNDVTSRYDTMTFRRGPEGCLDRCEPLAGGSIHVSGWAGDPDAGRSVSEVQLRLDGRIVQAIKPTVPRPDVVTVLREPGYATAGWEALITPESSAAKGSRPVLDITAVSDDGRTKLLHASHLDAVVGRKLF